MNFNISEKNQILLDEAEMKLIKTVAEIAQDELPNAHDTTIIIALQGIMFQSIKRICEAHHRGTEMMLNISDDKLDELGIDLINEVEKARGKQPGVRPV